MYSKGFTIVEIVVAMTIATILSAVLFGPLSSLFYDNLKGINTVIQTSDTRGALRFIEPNISLSTAFLANNVVADPAGTTWSYSNSGTYNVLITSNYATSLQESGDPGGTRRLAYTGSACNVPLENNYVYFVSGGKLYRRTLKRTTTPCSGTNGQKQTCVAGYTNVNCQATDALIASNVTSFTVAYYATPEATSTTTNPAAARSVVLTLTTRTGNGSNAITQTSKLRITRVNGS